jgi:NADH:ubiquinone oxidoreductase subunit 2 (subunit N)
MLGHAAVAEMGLTLLAVSLGGVDGLIIYFWLMIPRAAAYILWATALSLIGEREGGRFQFDIVKGLASRQPIPAAALLLAHFSLCGIPLLPAFFSRLALWQQLAVISPLVAGGAIVGSLGLLTGGLRTLNTFFVRSKIKNGPALDIPNPLSSEPLEGEKLLKWVLLSLSVVVLVILGMFPNIYLPWLERFLLMFELLGS